MKRVVVADFGTMGVRQTLLLQDIVPNGYASLADMFAKVTGQCPITALVGEVVMLYLEVSSNTVDNEQESSSGYVVTNTSWSFGEAATSQPATDFRSISENFDLKLGETIYIVVAIWSEGDSQGDSHDISCDIMSAHKELWKAEISADQIRHASKPVYLQDDYALSHLPWSGWFDDLSRVEVIQRIIK